MRLIVILALLATCALTGAQDSPSRPVQIRSASIDMQTVFANYHKTLQAAREVDNERAAIEKKSQLARAEIEKLREVRSEMVRKLEEGSLSADKRAQMTREIPLIDHDITRRVKQQQRDWKADNAKLNEQMVLRMERLLAGLQKIAASFAKEEGYDLLYDSSGKNTSQVPSVLFAKGVVDLSEPFAKSLRKP